MEKARLTVMKNTEKERIIKIREDIAIRKKEAQIKRIYRKKENRKLKTEKKVKR